VFEVYGQYRFIGLKIGFWYHDINKQHKTFNKTVVLKSWCQVNQLPEVGAI
jgi:hypothetical protein